MAFNTYIAQTGNVDQRVEWHTEHLKHCSCRTDFPKKLKEEMIKRNIEIPNSK